MTKNQSSKEEEVDLRSLFLLIKNGFKSLFNLIGNVLKGILHFFISILLFFKRHFIKFLLSIVVGGLVGTYLEVANPNTYGSSLLVKPNFSSAVQLYKNVNYYDDLVEQRKISQLASIFHLDTIKAAGLVKFEVNPILNPNDIIDAYNSFVQTVDTLTAKSYTFNEFRANFTKYDYKNHEILVESVHDDIFSGLEKTIIGSVTSNNYYNRIKKLTTENLIRTDSLLRENLAQVDSLRQVYIKVLIEESKKQSTGTTIDLGDTKMTTKEIELFSTDEKINKNLVSISEEIGEKSEIINVISNFQEIGYEIEGVTENYVFIAIGMSVLILSIILLLIELNAYLDKYEAR